MFLLCAFFPQMKHYSDHEVKETKELTRRSQLWGGVVCSISLAIASHAHSLNQVDNTYVTLRGYYQVLKGLEWIQGD